jgi:hypothetical protein
MGREFGGKEERGMNMYGKFTASIVLRELHKYRYNTFL